MVWTGMDNVSILLLLQFLYCTLQKINNENTNTNNIAYRENIKWIAANIYFWCFYWNIGQKVLQVL